MTVPRRTRIKFCGMTSAADVGLAVDAGADAVGVIVAQSTRRVELEQLSHLASSIPPYVARIGVMADQGENEAAALRALGFTLQFSGDESPELCERLAQGLPYIKVFHLDPQSPEIDLARYRAYRGALWMFDTQVAGSRGGTGHVFDWRPLAALGADHRIVVSGGLSAENVGACIRLVRPFGVDVRSGIESDGRKDTTKMATFVDAVSSVADEWVSMLENPKAG